MLANQIEIHLAGCSIWLPFEALILVCSKTTDRGLPTGIVQISFAQYPRRKHCDDQKARQVGRGPAPRSERNQRTDPCNDEADAVTPITGAKLASGLGGVCAITHRQPRKPVSKVPRSHPRWSTAPPPRAHRTKARLDEVAHTRPLR